MSSTTVPAPRASRRERLYAKPALHRAYPMALGYQYARYRTERWWRSDSAARRDARHQMRFLIPIDGPALDRLAKAYMFETFKREELGWRPWLTTSFPVDGLEHLAAARARGRGVLVNFAHHGHYGGVLPSLGGVGFPPHVATDPWFLKEHKPDYNGLLGDRHRHVISQNGARPFPAPGSYPVMVELLRQGEVVAIASDMPGGTEVDFLGRRRKIASGAARLSLETGAPVVPILARRRRWSQRFEVEPPIDPAGFGDPGALLQEIMRRHEPAIAAWPAAFDRPLRHFTPVGPEDEAEFGFPAEEYFTRFRL